MRALTIAILFWVMTFQALATSAYYINRTNEAIRIKFVVDTTAPVENGNQYTAPSEPVIIMPFERVKVAEFNRYYGIENGATYDYYIHVERQSEEGGGWVEEQGTPAAQVRLRGHGAGTKLYYGFKNFILKRDYEPYVTEMKRDNGRHAEFGVKALYVAGPDDVEFVIAEHDIAEVESRDNALQVATYNIWMIPSVSSNIFTRASMMEHSLSGYDVLALQEVFSRHREPMFDALSAEYPYRTEVVGGDSHAIYDGGVVTLSRYPILESDALVFDHCAGTDCYADKGIVYTKIDKNGEIYHIFNTHLASFDTREAKRLRRLQLGLLRTFMLTKQIPDDEAVIYAGDFNIDKNSDFSEYLLMLATLEVDPPAYMGYTEATFEPKINPYALAKYSGGEKSEFLDYVFVSLEHRRASKNTNTVKLKQRINKDQWGQWHLSDHFSVVGNFTFD
ncbi:hypothetical protein AND4_11284 [Vibrio sp. AND4]|nr:hypothetical protein AND4_11284 [Vibrio sp. AND4]